MDAAGSGSQYSNLTGEPSADGSAKRDLTVTEPSAISRTGPQTSDSRRGGRQRGRYRLPASEKPSAEILTPTSSGPPRDGPTIRSLYQKTAKAMSPPDNLTSTLIHSLSTPPYSDCPICFNAIHPAQPTWSCSPSSDKLDVTAQCCWTTFHLKCVRSWASKSVREVADARLARGEEVIGDWRCPGCQLKRDTVPGGYRCVPPVFFSSMSLKVSSAHIGVSAALSSNPNYPVSRLLIHAGTHALAHALAVMPALLLATQALVHPVKLQHKFRATAAPERFYSNALFLQKITRAFRVVTFVEGWLAVEIIHV